MGYPQMDGLQMLIMEHAMNMDDLRSLYDLRMTL